MRSASLPSLAALALLVVIGCDKPHPEPRAGDTSRGLPKASDTTHGAAGPVDASHLSAGAADTLHAAASPVDTSPVETGPMDTMRLAESLAITTTTIDTLVTLGTWVSGHPRDVVSEDVPEGADPDHVCRVATARLSVGGRRVVRSALFNLPNPPRGEALPADTNRLAEQLCHLRAIWFEMAESDSARALGVSDSIARILESVLGAGRAGLSLSGMGTGMWKGGKTWTGPGTTVALGILNSHSAPYSASESEDDAPRVTAKPGLVLVVAFTPHSGLDQLGRRMEFLGVEDEGDAERELAFARVDSAIKWAGVPRIAADLRLVLGRLRATRFADSVFVHTPAVDSALVRAAAGTRDTTRFLEPPRRAAALLAADLVLEGSAAMLDDVDTLGASHRLRTRLESVGVPFEHSPLGAVHQYTRPWLWDAYRLDSLGRTGHLALVTLLSAGWGTRATCSDGADGYNRVIEHGEAALRRGATDPLIHYYVALGYHDIVALSRPSAYDEYSDPKDFATLAPAARVKAIEHFRSALVGLSDRRMRRHAWRTAMSLMLGRSRDPKYFCVYD